MTGRGHAVEGIGLGADVHLIEVLLQPFHAALDDAGVHFIAGVGRDRQAKDDPGGLVIVGAVVVPPAPAAVVVLVAVEFLQAGVDLGR